MGEVPVDNTGCYVKYTFPNDFVLPSNALKGGYQGSGMMEKSGNQAGVDYSTLNIGATGEVIIDNQASLNTAG